MLKKRIAAFVVGVTLIIAVVGASANVANSLVTEVTASGQAIACNSTGASGGGC